MNELGTVVEDNIPYKDNFFKVFNFGEYNFFKAKLEKGETPKEISDQVFTTRSAALSAVNNYIYKMTVGKNTKNTKDD